MTPLENIMNNLQGDLDGLTRDQAIWKLTVIKGKVSGLLAKGGAELVLDAARRYSNRFEQPDAHLDIEGNSILDDLCEAIDAYDVPKPVNRQQA